jgi:hypothetical protein
LNQSFALGCSKYFCNNIGQKRTSGPLLTELLLVGHFSPNLPWTPVSRCPQKHLLSNVICRQGSSDLSKVGPKISFPGERSLCIGQFKSSTKLLGGG